MARYDPVHVGRSGVIMPRLRPRAKQIMRQPFPPLMAAAVSAVVSVGASQLLQNGTPTVSHPGLPNPPNLASCSQC